MEASPKPRAYRPGAFNSLDPVARSGAARITFRHAPPPARVAVQRPALFDRLDAAPPCGLMLITGSPGAGKTMLLSTWLAARPPPGPVAWLSLEPLDGRPARFWSELLKVVRESLGQDLPGLPDPFDLVDGELLAGLSGALDDLPVALTLILDDFEQLHSREVTETLDRFLRRPTPGLRLIIASRLDPGLSLQRLRLEGRLAELRSTDLALTREQAQELVAMAGVELTSEQVDKLHTRTEGWVGGLSLAALSLPGHPDPDGFVAGFAGDDRTIADYLVEEVLHQQPTEMREFMLRTSVVDRIEPDLADALTGRSDGARTLERLERSNAFLLPLDERRRWYRYHPMFKELLRSQLRYRMPDAFALEHRRAARWFAAHGMATAAVRHASTAGDLATTSDLLADHWLSLIAGGETQELVDWIDAMPRQVVAGRAELAVAGAGAALELAELEHADGYSALADANAGAVPAKRRAHYSLSRTVVKMLEGRLRGDFEASQTAARKVLAGHQLAGLPGDARALALLNLGVAECWMESTRGGLDHLEQALELAGRDGSEYIALGCLGQLALFEALIGQLGEGAGFGQAATRIVVKHGWDGMAAAAPAYLALAIVHYYRSELEAAHADLARSVRASRGSEDRTTRCLLEIFRALLLAPTDVHEAVRVVQAVAADIAEWKLSANLGAGAALVEARLLAESGDSERARTTLVGGAQVAGGLVEYGLVGARLALADGQPTEALRRLGSDAATEPIALHPSSHVEVLALKAVSNHAVHDDQRALALVEEALVMAQAQGFRQPLVGVGSPLRDLLKRRIRAGTAHRTLAGEVLALLEEREGVTDGEARRLLLDPLSDREEAVLRYLPTLMSKAEIASELFVSVNTVKTHTKNIYRKLGVGTRTEAVRRAKSLNLV